MGFIDAMYEVQIESMLGYMNPFGYITKEVTLNQIKSNQIMEQK